MQKLKWVVTIVYLEMFNDSSNGYLGNDCCLFGTEVHVIKNEGNREKISIIKEPKNGTFTWKIENFSTLLKLLIISLYIWVISRSCIGLFYFFQSSSSLEGKRTHWTHHCITMSEVKVGPTLLQTKIRKGPLCINRPPPPTIALQLNNSSLSCAKA